MKKISLLKSTTVRALWRSGLDGVQNRLPELVARLAETQFTRTRPNPLPQLGITEHPQLTWDLPAEGEILKVYAWGNPESAQRIALLSHGWNSNAWDLYPVVESLRRAGWTVVAADQVGHGQSSGRHSSFPQFARNLERVWRSLPRVDAFVGHSMGGAAGALAISRGLQPKAAVLLAPPADLRIYVQRFANHFGLSAAVMNTLQTRLEAREKVELKDVVPEAILGHVQVPALIFCDRKDREVGLEAAQRYAQHWAGSRLVVTEGLGHSRILGNPAVLDQLTAFVS
jgi:pimeloyl-ACP methyl ester carboxylesterase